MDIVNGVPQMGTIDVDKIWRQKNNESCYLEYVLFAKLERKYLKKIMINIEDLAESVLNKKHFYDCKWHNQERIHYIVESVNKLNVADLKELLEKEYSMITFLQKAYAIRKRNLNKSTK